jgi:hypothetical protein
MSAFDKVKKFETEFAENLSESFWTPQDPLSEDERDRLEHVQKELVELREANTPEA